MRRAVLAASVVALLGVVLPTANAASPVPGAKCAKAGNVIASSGKRYTCVKVKGKLVWSAGVVIAAPKTSAVAKPEGTASAAPVSPDAPTQSPVTSASPTASVTPSAVVFQQSPRVADSTACQIKDARIERWQPNNVGFPLTKDIVPSSGVAKIVFMPVDFPDAPGTPEFLKLMNEQMRLFHDWYRYFSNDKVRFEIQTADSWVRAPKKASEYIHDGLKLDRVNRPYQADMVKDSSQGFVDASGTRFNWEGVTGAFFFFPPDAPVGIVADMLARGVILNTPQGPKNLFFFSPGQNSLQIEAKLPQPNSMWWTLWLHEILHSQGIAMHAPGNGFPTGIGQVQENKSQSLDAWETYLLGWLNEDQIFCIPNESLSTATVILRPIESSDGGVKTAIVPVNDHEAVVVESRRPVGYSSGWDPTDKGIFVYHVDTTLDSNRSMEGKGTVDDGNNPEYAKWAYYLAPTGRAPIAPWPVRYKNYLMKQGESVTFKGVRVTLVNSSESDVIRVERAA